MEQTLKLPQNYVEIEQEEMMYLEGGWSKRTLGKNCMGIYNWASNKMGKGLSMALRQIGFYSMAYQCAYAAAPSATSTIVAVLAKAAGTIASYNFWVGLAAIGVLLAGAAYLGTYRVFY